MSYKKRDELIKELEAANLKIAELESRIIELEGEKEVHKIKNERNAGRKRRFTSEEIGKIQMMKLQGKSYRAVAKEMGCSVGLVHKLLNEPMGGKK